MFLTIIKLKLNSSYLLKSKNLNLGMLRVNLFKCSEKIYFTIKYLLEHNIN